jgi:hypothetical protein
MEVGGASVAVGVITDAVCVASAPELEITPVAGTSVGSSMPKICLTGLTMPWAIFGVTRKKRNTKIAISMIGKMASAEQPTRLGGEYKGYSSGSNGSLGLGVSIMWVVTCLFPGDKSGG